MALVRRGNVELEVHDDYLNHYLNKGFDQVDASTGQIIKKGTANNFNSLQLAYLELTKENQSLNLKVHRLEKENKELQAKLEQASKKSTAKTTKE